MINEKKIEQDGYVIAEIAQNHEGSLGNCFAYAKSAKEIGCDAVKFQMHIANEESTKEEKFRLNIFPQDNSRYDYWERTSFKFEDWSKLRNYCSEIGIDFIISPFSLKALYWSQKLKVNAIKIGSGEVNNKILLNAINNNLDNSFPVIISSGMSTYEELDSSITILKENNRLVIPMQCTSKYPTNPEDWGLENIDIMKKKYPGFVGFSDHSGDIYASLGAIAKCADLLEVHLVFSKQCFGPDTSSSVAIEQMRQIVEGTRFLKKSLNKSFDKNEPIKELIKMKKLFEKKIVAKEYIPKGSLFKMSNICGKKGYEKGMGVDKVYNIIGKKASKDYKVDELIIE